MSDIPNEPEDALAKLPLELTPVELESYPELSQENEDTINELIGLIEDYQGEFTLILARCQYANLRDRLLQRMRAVSTIPIHEIYLENSVKAVYSCIQAKLDNSQPAALTIVGLNTLKDIDLAIKGVNQVREEFRKNFAFPVIFWINDELLRKFIRLAPDFESWATTVEFTLTTNELINSLQNGADAMFAAALADNKNTFSENLDTVKTLGTLHRSELEVALQDLVERGERIEPRLQASLDFIRGLDISNYRTALTYLQLSLGYWQTTNNLERQGLLFYQIGRLHYDIAKQSLSGSFDTWHATQKNLEQCLAVFEQIERPDLVAKCILRLEWTLEYQGKWEALYSVVNKALPLHKIYRGTKEVVADYSFLAEIALVRLQWEEAKTAAQAALEVLEGASTEEEQLRGLCLQHLAKAEKNLGNTEAAIAHLLEAKAFGDRGYPQYYLKTLVELQQLYREQHRHLEAFRIKQEQFAIEQKYGFRAFIGAGRLQARRQEESLLNPSTYKEEIAPEIVASGRQQDIDRLIERIGRTDHKLTIIHGPSGVGKSSLVNAGLIPALRQQTFGVQDGLPIVIHIYTNWIEELGKALIAALKHKPKAPLVALADTPRSPNFTVADLLTQLKWNEHNSLRTVLIFDQFEEFFFVYFKQLQERLKFFEFVGSLLSNARELSSVNVIFSLREDYLHYLLECNRLDSMRAIGQDILSKEILYPIGNFQTEKARNLIQELTARSRFPLEADLIDTVVNDLQTELQEIRPIELQVIGSELEQSQISKLSEYKALGEHPTEILVQRSVFSVIDDCGNENKQLAYLVLYVLTDEKGMRPLRTKEELEINLKDLAQNIQKDDPRLNLILEIFVGYGLVMLVRESTGNRYQLVHDYLATFIRNFQEPYLKQLMTELEQEKEQRLKLETQVEQVRLNLTYAKLELDRINQATQQKILEAEQKVAEADRQLVLATQKTQDAETKLEQAIAAKEAVEIEIQNAAIRLKCADSRAKFLENQIFESLLIAINAGQHLQQIKPSHRSQSNTEQQVVLALHQSLYTIKEFNRLHGHSATVWSCSFSPNGELLVSAGGDQNLKIWNSRGQELLTLKGHTAVVYDAKFSPNGQIIASSSGDRSIKLWNLEGQELLSILGHQDSIYRIAFSADGQIIASASGDKTIKLWNLQGQELTSIAGHKSAVLSLAFSPDGQTIASSGADKTIKLWSLAGEELLSIEAHNDAVYDLRFAPDGQSMCSCSGDKTVKVWNLQGENLLTLTGHSDAVYNVSFTPDGQTLASASGDKTIKLWGLNGEEKATLESHYSAVLGLSFAPQRTILASASGDKTIKLWNLQGVELNTLNTHQGAVWSVCFSPLGDFIASASWDNTIHLWNTHQKKLQVLKGHKDAVYGAAFSHDGQMIASASRDKTIKLWNLDGQELLTLKGHTDAVYCLSFAPDNQMIVSASRDKTIKLWNLNGDELLTIKGHTAPVLCISISPDGQFLASSSRDKTAKLWSRDGRELATLEGHNDVVYGVSFSPDGTVIATASGDKTVRVWNLEGKEIYSHSGHLSAVLGLSFSPDGKMIASANRDKTIKLCTLEGEEVQTFRGHNAEVYSVAFSPDGKKLASADWNNSIIVWNLDVEDLLAKGEAWLADYTATHLRSNEQQDQCSLI